MSNPHETAIHLLANLLDTTFATPENNPDWVAQAAQATGVTSQMLEALAIQANDPNIAALVVYVNGIEHTAGRTGGTR